MSPAHTATLSSLIPSPRVRHFTVSLDTCVKCRKNLTRGNSIRHSTLSPLLVPTKQSTTLTAPRSHYGKHNLLHNSCEATQDWVKRRFNSETRMKEHDSPEARMPSFLDLFGVHLALRLVGKEALLKHLDEVASESNSFSVYWRTPLLQSASSDMMFLDVTVTFARSNISTKFGVLLRKIGNSTCYIQASPLTFSQLSNHSRNVGIDIDSTAADAMAHIMGSALMDVPNNAGNIKCFDGVESITVPVPLHYKDLQETSPFLIKSATISKLDSKTSNMMLFNFVQQDELISKAKAKVNEARDTVVDTQVSSQVTRAFGIWWNASASTVENNVGPQFVNELEKSAGSIPMNPYKNQDATDTRVDQSLKAPARGDAALQATAHASKMKNVKRAQVAGYVRVTTAKRKKKIGFAKPGTL